MPLPVGFTPEGAKRVAEATRRDERRPRFGPAERGRYPAAPGIMIRIAKNGGTAIPVRSGFLPGSGTVRLYDFDGTTLSDSTVDVTAFNLASNATTGPVGASKWLILIGVGGFWFVVWEEC